MGWIDILTQAATVPTVAAAVGLKPGRARSLGPCGLCSATQRGSGDKRGPIGVRADGRGWQCFKCDARGDAADIAAIGWYGARVRDLSPSQRAELRRRAAGAGWCDDSSGGFVVNPSAGRTAPVSGPPPAAAAARGWSVRPVNESPTAPPEPPATGSGPLDWRAELPAECAAELWTDDGARVLAYLNGRGFRDETLKHWQIGALIVRRGGQKISEFVAIPVQRRDGTVIGMRFRSVPGPCLVCAGAGRDGCRGCRGSGEVRKVYLRCKGQASTLFGVHQLDGDADSEIVIVEGELDVIALWQYGLRSNVVSGTAGAGTWAASWLDAIEPYRHFMLAYDDDEKGRVGAERVAKSLGLERCSRAVLPCEDASECLRQCVSQAAIRAALDAASPFLSLKLSRVDNYADELERMIASPGDLRGVTTGSGRLDEGIGGWAPGLVVVTGDTAAGKTSLTTWLGLEQALRGVPVLLTSFEQRPIGTVQKLLRAQLGGDFTQFSENSRRAGMRALGQLPIHLLDHYGELNTEQMRQALDYSVRRLNVRLAVIDHLGFLVRGAPDERRAIEDAVRDLAVFAVQRGITILLICHPNNLSIVQQRRVRLGDLKGASAIRQDAHAGLVVERLLPGKLVKHPAAAIYCDKVRSEFGCQGARVVLYYDPEACVYADSWEATPMGRSGGSGGFHVQT